LSKSISHDVTSFVLGKVQALNEYAKSQFKVSVRELVLACLIHHREISSLIVGMRSPKHVKQNLATASIILDEHHLDEISRIVGEMRSFNSFSFCYPNFEQS
jgi:aryl-alcohol dehydrogenase-like predicted oxidoreductase